jgi:hypothetical protein
VLCWGRSHIGHCDWTFISVKEANAKLIAAAPALLAACKAMSSWLCMHLEGQGTIKGEAGMDALQLGLAAIKQAEGGAE